MSDYLVGIGFLILFDAGGYFGDRIFRRRKSSLDYKSGESSID
jgi:hypothetical protein